MSATRRFFFRPTSVLMMLGVASVAASQWQCGQDNPAPASDRATGSGVGAAGADGSTGAGGGSSGAAAGPNAGPPGAIPDAAGGAPDASGGAPDATGGATEMDGATVLDGTTRTDGAGIGMSGDASYKNPPDSVVWQVDNLQSIGGHPISKVLGAPTVIDTPAGKAVLFNGVADALFVNTQPVAGFPKFTVEVVFRPDTGGAQAQRWFHMQAVGNDRVLFEMRLAGNNWFLVSFVQSGAATARAYAVAFPHPVGPWYHAAIVVDGVSMKHYINGVYENAGPCPMTEGCTPADVTMLASPYPLAYTPIGTGSTSLGCRITQSAFLKGAIRLARFTPRALTPAEFVPPP